MIALTLPLSYFLFLFFSVASSNEPPYRPTDYFLLNCGTSSNSSSWDQRNWEGDATSKFSPTNIISVSNASTASQQYSGVDPVPYKTSRIFHSPFTYSFPISPGPKFLRLYFYLGNYSKPLFFSVTTPNYTLLANFSASLNAPFLKEFIVTVKDHPTLNVTFSPSPNSYAFINGIEVVSIPDDFYIRGSQYQIKFVGQRTLFTIDDATALEKIYRFNVGGNDVGVNNDTGMFRTWINDDKYIYGAAFGVTPHVDIPIKYTTETPNYTAPDIIYTTSRTMGISSLRYNLTWIFPVDSGFYYLLRLYFCEIQPEVTRINERVFTIFINNQTAEISADVISWSSGRGIPVFRDYVIWVGHDLQGRWTKQDLWLSMYPRRAYYADALLNGLEIFKLNASNGNLAVPNPQPEPKLITTSLEKKTTKQPSSRLATIVGVVVGGAVFTIMGLLVLRRRQKVKDSATSKYMSRSTNTNNPWLPSDICRRFSLDEIKYATSSFDENFIIGSGGFGNVYRGYIHNDSMEVAVKRLNASSNQGVREFLTEIEMLSKLRHLHLVSLIGYCDENGEMVLVYDYMPRGTLRDHLYKSINPILPWKQRLQICIGAARGLHYLHKGAKHTIIHRDVKTTNILLDEKWVAKVCDFGLSKIRPSDVSNTHISTLVKGTFGYLDPEYFRWQHLTEKSDVYSFGVVLFEVLCGRPAVNVELPEKQIGLAEWARSCYREGVIGQIIDPHIKKEISPECLTKFGEIAYGCLQDQGINRPCMDDVVWSLEFALLLQEDAEKVGYVTGTPNLYTTILLHGEATTTEDEGDISSISTDHVSMSNISDTPTTSIHNPFTSQNPFS